MEKQSGSGHKQGSISSPAVSRVMQKQKAATMIDDQNRQSTEQAYSSHIQSQSQNLSYWTQPLSQLENEDPLANVNLDQLTGTQNLQASVIQLCLTNSQRNEMTELEEQLAQTHRKVEKLRHKSEKVEKSNEALEKYIESEDKIRNELIEKQNISGNRLVVIREQTAALCDTLASFKEVRNEVEETHKNVISKQNEKMKNLMEQFNSYVSDKEKELVELLMLKNNALFHAQILHQQVENRSTQMAQIIRKRYDKREQLIETIVEGQRRHDEEMKKHLDTVKEIEANFNIEREENSKLLAASDESSEGFKKLVTEFEALQVTSTERQEYTENLKSNIQQLNAKNKNLEIEYSEFQSKNLAITSEKNLEFADHRKILEDLSLVYEETKSKWSEINSNNEKLSDTIIKTNQSIEESKRDVLNKDNEITKLNEDLNNALEKSKELSAQTQSLDEELIARKKLISQSETDLETCDAKKDENGKSESELRARLAAAKQKLKNKKDDVAKLRKEMNDEKLVSFKEIQEFKQDIEQKNEQITELTKIIENLQSGKDSMESEHNRKLQQLKQASIQCQRTGHKKRIKEMNMKMDILYQKISAEKLKYEQKSLKNTEAGLKVKEQRKAHLKEIKSNIDDIERVISVTKEKQDELKKKLKKVQSHHETKSTNVQEPLNSSPLLGIMYGKHESVPSSSTPERTSQQNREAQFEFDIFSDMSSINGEDIFEEAERRYAEFLQNNKTDNAKLNKPDETGKL